MSSLLIAIMGRRMQLSLAEKRVNQVVAESQATCLFRHSAARVLQFAWLMLKWQRQAERHPSRSRNVTQFRLMQRNLLLAIIEYISPRLSLYQFYLQISKVSLEAEDETRGRRRLYPL
jgi:hypothetical protein